MTYYYFFTDRHRKNKVWRTESELGYSEFQADLKQFTDEAAARSDFHTLLFDNEDYRQGEYFGDTSKKQKVATTKKKVIAESSVKSYDIVPPDFKLELNHVYNLKAELFMGQVPDFFVDYIFTSPPYNIKDRIGEDDLYAEYHDNLTEAEYEAWLFNIIDNCIRITRKHVFFNIQMLARNKKTVLKIFAKYADYIKDMIIWNKSIAPPHIQPGCLNSKFEFIFIFSNVEPHMKVFRDAKWSQGTLNNVIDGINAGQNKYKKLNKATFPTYLPRTFMINFGEKDDIWYDPFMGTGTTAEAAEAEYKKWIGTEIDIDQCEVTNKRFSNAQTRQRLEFQV